MPSSPLGKDPKKSSSRLLRIAAIVLAAGASERMGTPKAVLRINEQSFIRIIIGRLRTAGVDAIFAVVGAHAEVVRREVEGVDVTEVDNPFWQKGQLSSIQSGIERLAATDFDAVMIVPVDHPAVATETMSAILSSYRLMPASIVLPVFRTRRGHPVLIDRSLFGEMLRASPENGAREVIRRDPARVREIETDDEGVITDIDTPEDFSRFLGTRS